MRDGSSDDHMRHARERGLPFAAAPSVDAIPVDDEPFALGEFVAALRRPADFGPSVDAAVMSAIRLAPAPLVVVPGGERHRATPATLRAPVDAPTRLPRAWRWFTRPRSVRITPLGALAAAGIAVSRHPTSRQRPASSRPSGTRTPRFRACTIRSSSPGSC